MTLTNFKHCTKALHGETHLIQQTNEMVLLLSLFETGNWGTETFSDLSKVTQLVNSRAEMELGKTGSGAHALTHYTINCLFLESCFELYFFKEVRVKIE